MNEIVIGHFEADGSDINLNCGFLPDRFDLVDMSPAAPMIFQWYREQESAMASGSQEGYQINGADGVTSKRPDSQGFTAYNTASQLPTVAEWTEAVVNAATARTATARGTLVKATIGATDQAGADVDRSAIFECTTAGTSSATEPTWNTAPDDLTTDGTAVFQLVTDKALGRIGYQGVVIAGEMMSDGQEYFYTAIQADNVIDKGDVVGWTAGVEGS